MESGCVDRPLSVVVIDKRSVSDMLGWDVAHHFSGQASELEYEKVPLSRWFDIGSKRPGNDILPPMSEGISGLPLGVPRRWAFCVGIERVVRADVRHRGRLAGREQE